LTTLTSNGESPLWVRVNFFESSFTSLEDVQSVRSIGSWISRALET